MKQVIEVDGGLGRVVCATGSVSKLEEKPIIVTGWLDVFEYSEDIDKQYPPNHTWLFEDVVKGNDYFKPEPYFDRLYREQKRHLSQSFNYLFNGCNDLVYPKLFLLESEKRWAKGFVDNIRKETKKNKVIAFQPFGSTYKDNTDNTERSLSWDAAQLLASKVDGICLNCSSVNLNAPNVWHREFTIRELFAVINECDAVLAIDSCVSHIGAAFKKPGMLILGGTYAENIGWPHYLHVMKNTYPRSYYANRFCGFKNMNNGAMDFSEEQILKIAKMFNDMAYNEVPLYSSDSIEDPVFVKSFI